MLQIDMMCFNLSTQLPIQPGSGTGHRVSPNTVTDIETTLQLWYGYLILLIKLNGVLLLATRLVGVDVLLSYF